MLRTIGLAILLGIVLTAAAGASPLLQLYIEPAFYQETDETWVTTDSSFRLWVLGNVGLAGSPIVDVQLTMAFNGSETGTVNITPVHDADFPAPVFVDRYDDSIPVMNDGHQLPSHGIYGIGHSFFQWELGDFTQTTDPIGDVQQGPPNDDWKEWGQVNIYDVQLTGFEGGVHFDTFNHVLSLESGEKWHSIDAPFSHDAAALPEVPEPGSLILLGTGLAGCFGLVLGRRKR